MYSRIDNDSWIHYTTRMTQQPQGPCYELEVSFIMRCQRVPILTRLVMNAREDNDSWIYYTTRTSRQPQGPCDEPEVSFIMRCQRIPILTQLVMNAREDNDSWIYYTTCTTRMVFFATVEFIIWFVWMDKWALQVDTIVSIGHSWNKLWKLLWIHHLCSNWLLKIKCVSAALSQETIRPGRPQHIIASWPHLSYPISFSSILQRKQNHEHVIQHKWWIKYLNQIQGSTKNCPIVWVQ